METQYEYRRESSRHEYEQTADLYDTVVSGPTYQSAIQPRRIQVSQSRSSGLASGGAMTRICQNIYSTGNFGFGPGLSAIAHFPGIPMRPGAALVGVNLVRDREKRDLIQLNDKFAQYVEKVRFLEAQNRKLFMELEALRSRSGQGSSRIKEMYDIEIAEAQKLINDTKRDAAAAELKAQRAEAEAERPTVRYHDIDKLREPDLNRIDEIRRKIAENKAQMELFQRRLGDLEDELRRYKAEAQYLTSQIGRVQNDIQQEAFQRASLDTEKMVLEDELASLQQIHDSEMNELRSQQFSHDLDPAQFFRNELSQAIKEIRNEYESALESRRAEMRNRFSVAYHEFVMQYQRPDMGNVANERERVHIEQIRMQASNIANKVLALRAENQGMKNTAEDLKRKIDYARDSGSTRLAEIEHLIEQERLRLNKATRDYDDLTAARTSLEKEINDYRTMLEGQDGLRVYVDRIVQSADQISSSMSSAIEYNRGTGSFYPGLGGNPKMVSHTFITSTGPSSNYGTSGGISNIVVPINRPSTGHYQTLSSVYTGIPLASSGEASASFQSSGDYSNISAAHIYPSRSQTQSP